MAQRYDYASIAAKDCLKIQPKEQVLIFADSKKLQFAEDLAGSVKSAGGIPSVFYIPASVRPVEDITDPQAVSLVLADVVIYVLETEESCGVSLSREVAFRHYLIRLPTQYKGRVCMMPGFTEEMKPALAIDYAALARRCRALKDLLSEKTVRITSELGTNVQFGLQGRKWILNDGDLSSPGLYGNLPAGEIYTAPVEESLHGRIVIDGSVGGLGQTDRPFAIDLESGKIKSMGALGRESKTLEKFTEICSYDAPSTETVGEFGIGMNPGARVVGNMLMDEKVMGTVHFAFGDSYGLGMSNSRFHTDVMITKPSIFVEGKCIMDNGEFTLDL